MHKKKRHITSRHGLRFQKAVAIRRISTWKTTLRELSEKIYLFIVIESKSWDFPCVENGRISWKLEIQSWPQQFWGCKSEPLQTSKEANKAYVRVNKRPNRIPRLSGCCFLSYSTISWSVCISVRYFWNRLQFWQRFVAHNACGRSQSLSWLTCLNI